MDPTQALHWLTERDPWVSELAIWMVLARLLLKTCNLWLQGFLTRLLAASASYEQADTLHALLQHRGYRIFAWLVDAIGSVKLPTHEQFHRVIEGEP